MSSTPIDYRSTDGSAPVIDGTAGSFLTWARAVLLNGYGSKSAAGWTEPFTAASNVAVFRLNSSVGTGAYVRFDDNSTGAGGAKEVLVRGYKTMSALSTGTDPCPTVAQFANGLVIRKSNTASSTARAWQATACRKWCYLIIDSSGAGIADGGAYFFGDIHSMTAADAYQFLLAACNVENGNAASNRGAFFSTTAGSPASVPVVGAYLMRNYAQTAGAIQVCLLCPFGTGAAVGSGPLAVPHGPNAGEFMTEALVLESVNNIRGVMPNLYWPWQLRPLTDLSTRADCPEIGTTVLAKSFRPIENTASGQGQLLIDITTAD